MAAVSINTFRSTNPTDFFKITNSGEYYDLGVMQAVVQTIPAQLFIPVTTNSITPGDQTRISVIAPVGTIAALTYTMPANPWDGMMHTITASQTVTALTQQANTNQTLNGALTTIGAAVATHGTWVYIASTATWYVV